MIGIVSHRSIVLKFGHYLWHFRNCKWFAIWGHISPAPCVHMRHFIFPIPHFIAIFLSHSPIHVVSLMRHNGGLHIRCWRLIGSLASIVYQANSSPDRKLGGSPCGPRVHESSVSVSVGNGKHQWWGVIFLCIELPNSNAISLYLTWFIQG